MSSAHLQHILDSLKKPIGQKMEAAGWKVERASAKIQEAGPVAGLRR